MASNLLRAGSRAIQRRLTLVAWMVTLALTVSAVHGEAGSTSRLGWEFLEAETALAQGEPRVAASHYRGAVREAWLLLGLIEVAEGDLPKARHALAQARDAAAVELTGPRVALALVELRLGEVEKPLRELRLLAQEDPRDAIVQRWFAEALWATGREGELSSQLAVLAELDPSAAAELTQGFAAPPAERLAPLPDLGDLGTATIESRSRLRARLAASLIRALRNLARLHEQTGFTAGVADLETTAEVVTASYPEAREPFGKVDVAAAEAAPRVALPRLDPVALMASVPPALQSVVVLFDEGELAAAAGELRKLLDGEHAALARALLGRLFAHRGDLDAAERELLQTVAEAPETSSAHQDLARLYWRTEHRSQAVEHLRRAAVLGPLDRQLSLTLAGVELAARRPEAASRQLRSLDKRFSSVEALLRLVSLWRGAGEEKRALDAADRATRQAPNSEEVLATHARLALDIGIVGSAARSVEPLVRMRPGVAEYRLLLGRTWSLRRKMGEAAEAYLKAIELDPDYLPALLPLGLALNHESRFEEARDHLSRYLEAHPEDLDALAGLAESEERLGEPESAERRALEVLSQAPNHPRAHLVAGLVRAGRGEFVAAREAFQSAAAADPLLAKAHYQLSLACARLGDRGCAAASLERYKRALEGPEATYVQLERAGPTLMKRQGSSPNDPPP